MERNPPIIGLTGPSGSGKGEVSRILAAKGGAILDADAVSREVMLPGGAAYAEVIAAFGREITGTGGEATITGRDGSIIADDSMADGSITTAGHIDRVALGGIVFADAEKKRLLERIVHKHVIGIFERETAALGKRSPPPRYVVWDAPLLVEAGMDKRCDNVWVVTAPYEVRLARIMTRDGLDERRARLRLDSQTPEGELAAKADALIVNDGDLQGLEEQVSGLLKKFVTDHTKGGTP